MQATPRRETSYSPVCRLWTTIVACPVASAGQSAVTGPGNGSGSLAGLAWPIQDQVRANRVVFGIRAARDFDCARPARIGDARPVAAPTLKTWGGSVRLPKRSDPRTQCVPMCQANSRCRCRTST